MLDPIGWNDTVGQPGPKALPIKRTQGGAKQGKADDKLGEKPGLEPSEIPPTTSRCPDTEPNQATHHGTEDKVEDPGHPIGSFVHER